MARRLFVAFALAAGCSPPVPAPPEPAAASRAIRSWHAAKGEADLVRVEPVGVDGAPGLWVAICDTELQWWGYFGCYRIRDGRVLWEASPDEAPSEQSIHSVRGRESPVLGGPLLEVVGRTHMGNGFLYAYALQGRALRRVLHTRAYDCNTHDPFSFRGGALDVDVREALSRGRLELELSGVLEERPEPNSDQPPFRSWPCSKTFVWDPVRFRFTEDAARRRGFERYPEPEAWPR